MRVTAGVYTDAVDLYNSVSGTWSTARLSVARSSAVAASVGNVSIFAGGVNGSGSNAVACVCAAAGCRFMTVTAGNGRLNTVDLYNSASGTWSTAQLSVARGYLAATSVGNVAFFAGGYGGNCSFCVV